MLECAAGVSTVKKVLDLAIELSKEDLTVDAKVERAAQLRDRLRDTLIHDQYMASLCSDMFHALKLGTELAPDEEHEYLGYQKDCGRPKGRNNLVNEAMRITRDMAAIKQHWGDEVGGVSDHYQWSEKKSADVIRALSTAARHVRNWECARQLLSVYMWDCDREGTKLATKTTDPCRNVVLNQFCKLFKEEDKLNDLLSRFWDLQDVWAQHKEDYGFDKHGLLVTKPWAVQEPPPQKHWKLVKGQKLKDPFEPVEINNIPEEDPVVSANKTKKTKNQKTTTASGSATTPANEESLRRSTRNIPKSDAIAIDDDTDQEDEDSDNNAAGSSNKVNTNPKKRTISNAQDAAPKKKRQTTSRKWPLERVQGLERLFIQNKLEARLNTAFPEDEALRVYLGSVLYDILINPGKPGSWGEESKNIVREILLSIRKQNSNSSLTLSSQDAAEYLSKNTATVPIFVCDIQPALRFGLLAYFRDTLFQNQSKVAVQDHSRPFKSRSFGNRSLHSVRERFLEAKHLRENIMEQEEPDGPLCLLDLPVPDHWLGRMVPSFVHGDISPVTDHGDNTDLLALASSASSHNIFNKLGKVSGQNVSRQRNGTELLDKLQWAIMAEMNYSTTPHMDAFGLATWIQAQEGPFVFAWLSRDADLRTWAKDEDLLKGHWHFRLLQPGHTVFFPRGTVHVVLRNDKCPTMSLGGHILQWSDVYDWLQHLIEYGQDETLTNETQSAEEVGALVAQVASVVANSLDPTFDSWPKGDPQTNTQFLDLAAEEHWFGRVWHKQPLEKGKGKEAAPNDDHDSSDSSNFTTDNPPVSPPLHADEGHRENDLSDAHQGSDEALAELQLQLQQESQQADKEGQQDHQQPIDQAPHVGSGFMAINQG